MARYLGARLGARSNASMWHHPAVKWAHRSVEIAQAGAPPPSSARLYNIQCITVLTYSMQLRPVTSEMLNQARYALSRAMHLPPNAVMPTEFFQSASMGFIELKSILLLGAASLARAAVVTVKSWPDCVEMLRLTAEAHFSMVAVDRGELQPRF